MLQQASFVVRKRRSFLLNGRLLQKGRFTGGHGHGHGRCAKRCESSRTEGSEATGLAGLQAGTGASVAARFNYLDDDKFEGGYYHWLLDGKIVVRALGQEKVGSES